MIADQQVKLTVFFILVIVCLIGCHRDNSSSSLQPIKVAPNKPRVDREVAIAYFLDALNRGTPPAPPSDGTLRLTSNAVIDEVATRAYGTTIRGITIQPEAMLVRPTVGVDRGDLIAQLVFSVLFDPEVYTLDTIEKTFHSLGSCESIVRSVTYASIVRSVTYASIVDGKSLLSPLASPYKHPFSTGPNGEVIMTMSGRTSTRFDMRQTDHGCAVGVFSVSMKLNKDELMEGEKVRIFLSPQKIVELYNRMNRGMPRVMEQHIHSLPSELQAYPYKFVTSTSASNQAPWP